MILQCLYRNCYEVSFTDVASLVTRMVKPFLQIYY
nr:MAG TPA: hypothetical protein [Caudoviricetes sp.]